MLSNRRSWSNHKHALSTSTKGSLQPKVLVCIWWDWKGIVYYELLSENLTINTEKYCSQLNKLKRVIGQKHPELANRKGIMIYQDNAGLHAYLTTRHKLLQLDQNVLFHLLYYHNLAHSNYHLDYFKTAQMQKLFFYRTFEK